MNLDELTAVWRSQNDGPLHGVNETLLLQTLRHEQETVRKTRRLHAMIVYGTSAFFVGLSLLFLAIMIDPYDDDVLAGWEYAIPVAGMAAALVMAGAFFKGHRTLARLEQHFGESLRDQIRLRIAQLDYEAAKSSRLALLTMMATIVCATAITLGSRVINDMPFAVDPWWAVRKLLWWTLLCAAIVWISRRAVERRTLPRKRNLESLLKEIDGI